MHSIPNRVFYPLILLATILAGLVFHNPASGQRAKDFLKKIRDEQNKLKNQPKATLTDALLSGELIVSPGSKDQELRFVYVAPGTVRFGLTNEERDLLRIRTQNPLLGHNCSPQTSIRVTRGFFLLDHEVTESEFHLFLKETRNPKRPLKNPFAKDSYFAKIANARAGSTLPVTNISWLEAMAYCEWLQKKTGHLVRLPTEIEWEYAARGNWETFYPWSGKGFHAWAEKGTKGEPRSLDRKKSKDVSWCGVYDLGGNVSEWCLDLYTDKSPVGKKTYNPNDRLVGEYSQDELMFARTIRGGNFRDSKTNCVVSIRRSLAATQSENYLGFRPVLLIRNPQSQNGTNK